MIFNKNISNRMQLYYKLKWKLIIDQKLFQNCVFCKRKQCVLHNDIKNKRVFLKLNIIFKKKLVQTHNKI